MRASRTWAQRRRELADAEFAGARRVVEALAERIPAGPPRNGFLE